MIRRLRSAAAPLVYLWLAVLLHAPAFDEGRDRNRALGVWGAMAGLGGSSGVLLGGVLTQGVGWPAIFLINVPIGLAVVLVGPRVVPEGRAEGATKHFDASGAVLVIMERS